MYSCRTFLIPSISFISKRCLQILVGFRLIILMKKISKCAVKCEIIFRNYIALWFISRTKSPRHESVYLAKMFHSSRRFLLHLFSLYARLYTGRGSCRTRARGVPSTAAFPSFCLPSDTSATDPFGTFISVFTSQSAHELSVLRELEAPTSVRRKWRQRFFSWWAFELTLRNSLTRSCSFVY